MAKLASIQKSRYTTTLSSIAHQGVILATRHRKVAAGLSQPKRCRFPRTSGGSQEICFLKRAHYCQTHIHTDKRGLLHPYDIGSL
jgi:hypothetical protein